MNGTEQPPVVATSPRHWSRLIGIALFLGAVYFVVHSMAPHTLGETARRKLLADLRAHYSNHKVSIRRGHFDPKVGLTFGDIRILTRGADGRPDKEMVRIERLTVYTDVHPEKLLERNLPISTKAVLIEGLRATAWLEEEDQLSLKQLLPLPSFGPAAPKMVLRRVEVNLIDGVATHRPITTELDEVVITNSTQDDGSTNQVIALKGSADFADELLVRVDDFRGNLDVRCSLKGAHLNRDLIERMPRQWHDKLRDARGLQCVCDATVAMRQQADGKINYQVRTTVHDGRFEHPVLPKPISEMRGVVTCTPAGIKVEASQGTFGDAIVRATGTIDGYQWPCVTDFRVSARGLLLDDRLSHALPANLQVGWGRLQPLGRVDIDAKLSHAASRWKSEATVMCKGVDVRYEKFPYPVENVVGRIEIADGIATADTLTGRVGGNRMQCAFRLPTKPDPGKEKSFVIATDGPVPIDKTLLSALSPRGGPKTKLESFVRSLRPRGAVQLASAVIRTDKQGKVSRKVDLRVIDGHLRYEKFAYPLYNVSGKIIVDDELVTISGMRATNANAGTIFCDGAYRMPTRKKQAPAGTSVNPYAVSDDARLKLQFRAQDVPMDESLRSSLPASSQQVWDALAPGGVLDRLDVTLEQLGTGTPLNINLTASQDDHPEVTSRSLSLRPTSLPYRLDVTGGTVKFDGKKVTIESIRGRHDASTVSADGFCVQDSAGRWELLLNLHSGSRLHPDAELITALPAQMRVAMRALQLRGPVSVRGQTRFAMPDARHPEPEIQWDIVLQLEGNRIADVGPVHSLRGELSAQGVRDERGIRARGEVRIDSMHVHDIQITGIRGPFSIDGNILFLGGASTDPTVNTRGQVARPPSSIRGRLFDGAIDLDGKVILSSGNFDVGLTVHNAQLPTMLADFGHSDNELTGTLSGQTQLQGNLGTNDLLRGNGAARVTGANLYKLPLIVQVLNLLRVKATEDVAFTDGDVEFTLYGETVTFQDLHIWGDLVALQGGGTLNRRRELDLTFETQVSPQNSFTQLVRPLGQRYTLGTIEVSGPMNDLQIERKALERVSETLEWLIPGMAAGSKPSEDEGPLQGLRSLFP